MKARGFLMALLATTFTAAIGCAPMPANPPPASSNSGWMSNSNNPLKLGSAGHTGCVPDENVVSNVARNPDGSGTWNVACKGKVYLCSAVALRGDSMSVSCAPAQ